MTADPSSLIPEAHSLPESHHSPFKRFVLSNIQGAIAVSVMGAVALFGASTWNIWQLYQGFQTTIQREFKLQDLSNKIVYYDEVLTMSARMSASTAKEKWEQRYKEYEPQLIESIDRVSKLVPEVVQAQTSQTNQANERLIKMEGDAFKLVQSGKAKEALALLLSPEYETQKGIYSEGIEATIQVINEEITGLQAAYSGQLKIP